MPAPFFMTDACLKTRLPSSQHWLMSDFRRFRASFCKADEAFGMSGAVQGFPLTRLVANMEWALEDRPGVDDIVEYETRLNYVLPKYDDAVC